MDNKINATVFLTVAETGSFRKAADELGYTQAGISYIIGAMEEAAGCSLFLREHGGVKLTSEGELLLPQIQQLHAWERRFAQTVNELNGLEKGTLRVQIFDSVSVHWIPKILREFCRDYPGIKVELFTEENARRAEEMVLNGEADCGFFLTGKVDGLDTIPLIEEHLMAVVSPDHPLANEKHFPISQIEKYPYIRMKYEEASPIGQAFREENITPNVAFTMDNDYAAMAMVSNGLGFCIFPELLLKNIPYDLKCLTFDMPKKRTLSVGTRNMETASKACRKFIEYTCRIVQAQEGVHPA